MTTAHCNACKTTKPLTEFYPHNTRGHRSCCKDCDKRRVKAYQATPRGKEIIKITQANQNTPECRERRKLVHREWQHRNREKIQEQQRRSYWRLKGEERKKRQLRANNLKYFYGITIADYEAMEHQQEGKCAICGGPPANKRSNKFHIDHDHETGKIRGLLCFRCNGGLGLFLDNQEILLAAAKYLGKHANND